MPPLGYYNRAFNGLKDIMVDQERARIIKEMFERAAKGYSGRELKTWLDQNGFRARTGKKLSLSRIYNMLKNSFYYGEFEYPAGNGTWYKGSHKPLITKELFSKAQKELIAPQRSKWGSKGFAFRNLIKCDRCDGTVVGEEKFRKLKNRVIIVEYEI
jgi:site-specific DNA recombinase